MQNNDNDSVSSYPVSLAEFGSEASTEAPVTEIEMEKVSKFTDFLIKFIYLGDTNYLDETKKILLQERVLLENQFDTIYNYLHVQFSGTYKFNEECLKSSLRSLLNETEDSNINQSINDVKNIVNPSLYAQSPNATRQKKPFPVIEDEVPNSICCGMSCLRIMGLLHH